MKDVEQLKDEFKEKIRKLEQTIWENKTSGRIDDWLNCFENETERINALFLLSQFHYFGSIQMRELLKVLFRDLYKYRKIEEIRKNNNNTVDIEFINKLFQEELANTRFLGVGNPSESGSHLLYFFRQENKLPKKMFVDPFVVLGYYFEKRLKDIELNNSAAMIDKLYETTDFKSLEQEYRSLVKDEYKKLDSVKEYVFIDDFCGSGSQAKIYSRDIVKKIKAENPNIKVSYLMLFATKDGIEAVKNETKFDFVEAIFELDSSFRCFSKESRYFKKTPPIINMQDCINTYEKYGFPMMKDFWQKEGIKEPKLTHYAENDKFGYGDCQLLLGFHHNTPDNTLPIFWYDEAMIAWSPIFKRYNKIYN